MVKNLPAMQETWVQFGLGRSPGEGHGNPLQYSGLENSKDCIAHGITKSRTRLSNFHFPIHCTTREALNRNTFKNVAQKAQLFKCSCAHYLIPGFSLLCILGCPEHSMLGSGAFFSLSVERNWSQL